MFHLGPDLTLIWKKNNRCSQSITNQTFGSVTFEYEHDETDDFTWFQLPFGWWREGDRGVVDFVDEQIVGRDTALHYVGRSNVYRVTEKAFHSSQAMFWEVAQCPITCVSKTEKKPLKKLKQFAKSLLVCLFQNSRKMSTRIHISRKKSCNFDMVRTTYIHSVQCVCTIFRTGGLNRGTNYW